ncbi:lectin-like domain-containing protein [Leucobacter coleopterorum]|uniref:lectin-like domain-containing protein n=1 Tax=Leucobacter coleopterorum TaxID=2714933 RepID=UPI003CC765DC
MVFNRALPSSAGLRIEFDQVQYGDSPTLRGADGIGFFLSDGSNVLTKTGAFGGSLGYAQDDNNPGVVGGYLGVGLDGFGNFINNTQNKGAGCETPSPYTGIVPNSVTLRGPGNGFEGYCFLASTATPPPVATTTLPGSLRVQAPVNPKTRSVT